MDLSTLSTVHFFRIIHHQPNNQVRKWNGMKTNDCPRQKKNSIVEETDDLPQN